MLLEAVRGATRRPAGDRRPGRRRRNTRELLGSRRLLPDLAGRVALLPPFDDQQPRELYGEADVFVLPSRNESFGMVAAEAAAAGVAVVLTDQCGVAELLAAMRPSSFRGRRGHSSGDRDALLGRRRAEGADSVGRDRPSPRSTSWDASSICRKASTLVSLPVDLAVVGQDPGFAGGALAQMQAFLAGARSLGRTPELVYVPHPTFAATTNHARIDSRCVRPAPRGDAGWLLAFASRAPCGSRRRSQRMGWLRLAPGARTGAGSERRSTTSGSARAGGPRSSPKARPGVNAPFLRRIERQVLTRARRVYATSPSARAAVAAAGGLDERDILILPIPVDTRASRPRRQTQRGVRGSRRPQLVFVGRADDPRKNVGLLLSAFEQVRVEHARRPTRARRAPSRRHACSRRRGGG